MLLCLLVIARELAVVSDGAAFDCELETKDELAAGLGTFCFIQFDK